MFTGIVESVGIVKEITQDGSNLDLLIESPISQELKIDQSVAHNGICLTVVKQERNNYLVTAVEETINKTNLGTWRVGDFINLERALKVGDRMDGHFVQGHVDQTAEIKDIVDNNGSRNFIFEFDEIEFYPIEKGSICVNGISLTSFNVKKGEFAVAIIPYTFDNTNLSKLIMGDKVNLEFDMMGKYLVKYMKQAKVHDVG